MYESMEMGSFDRPVTSINPLSICSARRRAGENRWWSASSVFALELASSDTSHRDMYRNTAHTPCLLAQWTTGSWVSVLDMISRGCQRSFGQRSPWVRRSARGRRSGCILDHLARAPYQGFPESRTEYLRCFRCWT